MRSELVSAAPGDLTPPGHRPQRPEVAGRRYRFTPHARTAGTAREVAGAAR